MRALACAALCLGAATATAGVDEEQQTINAKDLRKYFEPYLGGIRDCYVALKEGDGGLRLELVIHRDGSVYRFGFEATGLSPNGVQRLDHCLRPQSEKWHFPVRRGFTTAIVPIHFQRSPGGVK